MVKARDPILVHGVDRTWFEEQLARAGITKQELARKLPRAPHPSAITHFLDGVRRVYLDEAVVLARLFGVSLEEIARRAAVSGDETRSVNRSGSGAKRRKPR